MSVPTMRILKTLFLGTSARILVLKSMAPPKSARTSTGPRAEGPKRTETTPNPSLNPDTAKPYDGLQANSGLYGP